MHRAWKAVIAAALLGPVVVSLAAPAAAQGLALDVAKKAHLVGGGETALVVVTAECPAGGELLEAFVYLNQDGHSTQFGGINIPCDGEPHTVTASVTALDFTLHPGKASASGYMLLTTGQSISPSFPVRLR